MYQVQYIITGIFNHKIIQKSALHATSKLETSQNRISAPMLMEGFPTLPRAWQGRCGLADLDMTKQNKKNYISEYMNTQISEINPSIYTKKTLFESHPSCREE
jgi:hypothetical protein